MSPLLHSLKMSDFRSIRGEVFVPLDAPVVLIHGPNGVGKTTFLSGIELALTGDIPSLARAEPDYASHLVHKQASQGTVALKVEGLPGYSDVSFSVTASGIQGKPLLPKPLAKLYSERCYLPQSVLGRLLELYQSADARESDSPLTEFVKDLLRLDQLDALIDGLHDAGDIRRLRAPVPLYYDVRDDIDNTERRLRTDDAELGQLRNEVTAAEAKLKETASAIDDQFAEGALDVEAVRRRLDRSGEERRLSALARLRRDLEAARLQWRSLSASGAVDQRQRLERDAAAAAQQAERWRASTGRQIEELIEQLANVFPDLPSSAATDPEFARATALRSVQKEHVRCGTLLAQDEVTTKRLAELDQELARAQARAAVLDQQISGLASDAGTLAQALARIAPHIHTENCPVCGRDFREISKRPLSAHVSNRIESLTESAGRLQALSQEKATSIASIGRLTRERSQIAGQQISNVTRNQLKQRRAQLEDIERKFEALAEPTQQGVALLTQAAQTSRALDAVRSRDLQITNFRDTLTPLGATLGVENLDLTGPVESILDKLSAALAAEESKLADLLQRKQRASADLAISASLRARLAQSEAEVAARKARLGRLRAAKAAADERVATARECARKAREVRTSVVRRVFNDSLNHIWHDLFVRLAPEEPFVPAFALPANTEGPVEAVLETLYRDGSKGGNPRAMLSAGNLNTAALTLFLSLHLAIQPTLPWLVIDDPVQSMDEVHIAQFAALLRTLSKGHGRQIILAVHERSLFEYLALELNPASEGDRLITIELGQTADGTTVCHYEPRSWTPDPAFAAA